MSEHERARRLFWNMNMAACKFSEELSTCRPYIPNKLNIDKQQVSYNIE